MPPVGKAEPIQYPAEPGVMFQIRRLSGHDLRKAETADTKKKLQVALDAGSALEILGELKDKVRTRVEAARVARGEPAEGRAKGAYESYDLETVIELGLIEAAAT